MPLCLLAPAPAARADDSRQSRRERIEKMTTEQKEELRRRQQQFQQLDPAEQQRICRLHEAIEKDPHADQLREVMHRYTQWVKTLPAYRRAELLELEPKERLKRVKEWYEKELAEQASRVKKEDIEGLSRWMDKFAAKHEQDFLKTLPVDRRKRIEELPPTMQQQATRGFFWGWWLMVDPARRPATTDADLAELRSELTPETRQRLASMPPDEQWRTAIGWISQALRDRFAAAWQGRGPMAVPDEQLADFFENELTAEERDRLLSLPGEEMQRELQRQYLMRMNLLPPRHGPGGPGGPGAFGERRPWRGGPPREGPEEGPGRPGPPQEGPDDGGHGGPGPPPNGPDDGRPHPGPPPIAPDDGDRRPLGPPAPPLPPGSEPDAR